MTWSLSAPVAFLHSRSPVLRAGVLSDRSGMQQPAEKEEIERAASGDVEAWTALYRRHHPRVYRRIRLLTGSASVAQDLTQDCFVRAMVNLPSFAGQSKFSTWLHGIATNLVRDHWRKVGNQQKKRASFEQVWALGASDKPGMEKSVAHRQKMEVVYEVLAELPETLRMAFVLRELENLSSNEVAELLETTRNNVDVRVNRARQKVRAALLERGWKGSQDV